MIDPELAEWLREEWPALREAARLGDRGAQDVEEPLTALLALLRDIESRLALMRTEGMMLGLSDLYARLRVVLGEGR